MIHPFLASIILHESTSYYKGEECPFLQRAEQEDLTRRLIHLHICTPKFVRTTRCKGLPRDCNTLPPPPYLRLNRVRIKSQRRLLMFGISRYCSVVQFHLPSYFYQSFFFNNLDVILYTNDTISEQREQLYRTCHLRRFQSGDLDRQTGFDEHSYHNIFFVGNRKQTMFMCHTAA